MYFSLCFILLCKCPYTLAQNIIDKNNLTTSDTRKPTDYTWSLENSKYLHYGHDRWRNARGPANDERLMLKALVPQNVTENDSYYYEDLHTVITKSTPTSKIFSTKNMNTFSKTFKSESKRIDRNYGMIATVINNIEIFYHSDDNPIVRYDNVTARTNYLHEELVKMGLTSKLSNARKDDRSLWSQISVTESNKAFNTINFENAMRELDTGIFCTFLREILKITATKEDGRHINLYQALEILLAIRLGQDIRLTSINKDYINKIHTLTNKLVMTDQTLLKIQANDTLRNLYNCGTGSRYGLDTVNVIGKIESIFQSSDFGNLTIFLEAYKDYPRSRLKAAVIVNHFLDNVLVKILVSPQRNSILQDINQIISVYYHGDW